MSELYITPGKSYKEVHNYGASLGKEMESNLKLLKKVR